MKRIQIVAAFTAIVLAGCGRSDSTTTEASSPQPVSTATTTLTSTPTRDQGLILPRITAESTELFDQANPPKCSLMSMQVSDLPKTFSFEMHNMIEWPKDYQPPKPYPYTDDDKYRIIADGMFYQNFGHGMGVRCIGKSVVDKGLNPNSEALIWDGKKEGAVHTIVGTLTMFDYVFDSMQTVPLKFKVTKNGYLYLEGEGTVTDLKTGKKYTLK